MCISLSLYIYIEREMYMCIHAYIYIYICTYTHTYISIYIYICMIVLVYCNNISSNNGHGAEGAELVPVRLSTPPQPWQKSEDAQTASRSTLV